MVAVRDEHEEAALVAQTIREAREAGTELREMAVFYRVHAQSRVLEERLREAKLPYRIVGGTKFFERAEIKDALSYLRVMVNDKSDVDLLRVINTPPRGIGQATIDRLTALATSKSTSVYDALAKPEEAADITGAPLKKLRAVRDLLAGMKKTIEQMTPSDALLHVLDTTGYLVALQGRRQRRGRRRASRTCASSSARCATTRPKRPRPAKSRRSTASSSGSRSAPTRTTSTRRGSVTLMTVHAAKGLEFKGVIITGMEEDMFPYRSMQDARPDDIDEERRLAYVAITRARERLMLIHTRARQIFGQTRWGRPSRFLSDIPHDVVVHRVTRGAQTPEARYFETPARSAPAAGAFRDMIPHPMDVDPVFEGDEEVFSLRGAPPSSMVRSEEVGGRYVDRDYFSDDEGSGDESRGLRKGAKVRHERFGEGVVRQVLPSVDPAVVAFFPAWGEKKVLVRYLRLA